MTVPCHEQYPWTVYNTHRMRHNYIDIEHLIDFYAHRRVRPLTALTHFDLAGVAA